MIDILKDMISVWRVVSVLQVRNSKIVRTAEYV